MPQRPPPTRKKKTSWSFQNINYSTMMPACEKGTHDGFVCVVAQLKSTSPVAACSWGPRLSPQPGLRAGEGCMLGQPGCQVAAMPAGWARSNQGCGAQLELPTSAPFAHGWLKAKLRSAWAWEWPWGESKQAVWKTPKRSSRFCVWHQMDCTHSERKYCCCAIVAICINPLPPSWVNH